MLHNSLALKSTNCWMVSKNSNMIHMMNSPIIQTGVFVKDLGSIKPTCVCFDDMGELCMDLNSFAARNKAKTPESLNLSFVSVPGEGYCYLGIIMDHQDNPGDFDSFTSLFY